MLYAQVATCKYVTLVTQEIKVVERQSIVVNLEEMQLRNLSISPGDRMLRLFPQKFCCGLSNEHLDEIEQELTSSTDCLLKDKRNKSCRQDFRKDIIIMYSYFFSEQMAPNAWLTTCCSADGTQRHLFDNRRIIISILQQ